MTPCDTPPALPDYARSVADLRGDWYVARVWGQKEKVVAHSLRARGIGYFLPTYRKESETPSGKKRHCQALIVPHYVFACVTSDREKYALQDTRFVIPDRLIHDFNQRRFVQQLIVMEHTMPDVVEVLQHDGIEDGVLCRVRPGHRLVGVEGYAEWFDENIVHLRYEFMGASVSEEVPSQFLEMLAAA